MPYNWKPVSGFIIMLNLCIFYFLMRKIPSVRSRNRGMLTSSTLQKISTIIDYDVSQAICNETNDILQTVYNRGMANESHAKYWKQDAPFSVLDCQQLIRSIPNEFHSNYNDTAADDG